MDGYDKRHEKSWNDPPMFSIDQLNKASNSVPLNKRYRYPQQPQTANQPMYQQNVSAGYGFPSSTQPAQQFQPQQQQQFPPMPQQQYPASYSPFGEQSVSAAPQLGSAQAVPNYANQYSQFPTNQMQAMNAYPPNAAINANYNASPNAYNSTNYPPAQASQFTQSAMQPHFQPQSYNPQARY